MIYERYSAFGFGPTAGFALRSPLYGNRPTILLAWALPGVCVDARPSDVHGPHTYNCSFECTISRGRIGGRPSAPNGDAVRVGSGAQRRPSAAVDTFWERSGGGPCGSGGEKALRWYAVTVFLPSRSTLSRRPAGTVSRDRKAFPADMP